MIEATWQVVSNPVTFQTCCALKIKNNERTRNTKVSVSLEQLQDKIVNDTEIMLMLFEELNEEEVGPAFDAWKKFIVNKPKLPTN